MRFFEKLANNYERKHIKEIKKAEKQINKPIKKSTKKRIRIITLRDLIIVYGISRALTKSEQERKRRAIAALKRLKAEREEWELYKNSRLK